MTAQTMLHEGTASQQASARQHHSRRDEWVYVTNKTTGQQFIRIPSSCKPGQGYYVSRTGDACTCEGSRRYPVCSHMLAVRLDIAERAAIEIKHQQVLQDWLDDLEAPVQPASAYQLLYPSCWTRGCDNDPEANGEGGCHLHSNVDAF